MSDLLVRLYDLPESEAEARVKAAGIMVRRAIPPERYYILDWVRQHFHDIWAGEAALALSQLPVTLWVAVREGKLLGFACHDTSAKGFFGPTGVDEEERGQGIGEALLIATLKGMREAGYGYAVIGDPGPVEFYRKRLDALEIPKSKLGIYAGMLRERK
ncbi:MAG: GNAT family N-acetyltransferase [Devosia sp.]|nr:GNAT family N-acetyltransferase [Devosia sp.]